MTQIIKPPFTARTARAKVLAAENAWNTRDPDIVTEAYTADSDWRNRDQFFKGKESIKLYLKQRWQKELNSRLMKELWGYTSNRISVRFEYEWQDAESGAWYRTHGNEHCEFNDDGLLQLRDTSANDIPITTDERRIGPQPKSS